VDLGTKLQIFKPLTSSSSDTSFSHKNRWSATFFFFFFSVGKKKILLITYNDITQLQAEGLELGPNFSRSKIITHKHTRQVWLAV
jgi:hypothetical protein